MQYTTLGNSGIKVSRLCLGCMSFGDPASKMHAWTLNPAESEEVIRTALDLGINFFDTANTYSAGTSEEYLGAAIRKIRWTGCPSSESKSTPFGMTMAASPGFITASHLP